MGLSAQTTNSGADRVMIVDDSAVVRGMLRKWIEPLHNVDVVASAENGQKAIELARQTKPHLIILDVEMPVMDGITALPKLLRAAPGVKVLMASTLTRRSAEISLRALSLGATDYLEKPTLAKQGRDVQVQFRDELTKKVVACLPKSGASTGGLYPELTHKISSSQLNLRKPSIIPPRVLAFGSSTGGPQALSDVFTALKGRLGHLPVLVTQHMPATFTKLLAEKLGRSCELPGGEAKDKDVLEPGRLYVAPGGYHMRLKSVSGQVSISLDQGPPINHCRPAVDPLFDSVAREFGSASLCVVLTGMGSDGANGGVSVAKSGGTVLAQDEATSVVWGMPGATVAAGAVAEILPLQRIAPRIVELLHRRRAA